MSFAQQRQAKQPSYMAGPSPRASPAGLQREGKLLPAGGGLESSAASLHGVQQLIYRDGFTEIENMGARSAMDNFTPVPALLGGFFIGLSAALFLVLSGRIAGVSGIIGGLFHPERGELGWRLAFVVGLLVAPLLYAAAGGALPPIVRGYQSDMPAYGDVLSDREIWAVLAYIKPNWPPEVRRRQPQPS